MAYNVLMKAWLLLLGLGLAAGCRRADSPAESVDSSPAPASALERPAAPPAGEASAPFDPSPAMPAPGQEARPPSEGRAPTCGPAAPSAPAPDYDP
ncbi:hypothetical protein RZS08_00030, partial [Arthrospira platensis SPKY1]|nr:hypothetical protein [Arthrospira platensis SPKY1]